MVKISKETVKKLRDKQGVQGMTLINTTRMTSKYVDYDPKTDYSKQLRDDEIKYENGRPFVFLHGLERLAKERGVKHARPTNVMQLGTNGVMVTYEYTFHDGCSYGATADATTKNCDGNFRLYLSAMAESRAKARALRVAFAIKTCSVEEKSDMTLKEDLVLGPIGDEQVHLIKLKAKEHNLGKADLFNMLEVPTGAKELKKLTKEEGLEIITALNKFGKKKTKRRTKKLDV